MCFANLWSPRSFLAGSIPLSFALSTRQLRLITAIGTGVLVGTSLIVIIPEGVETLYSASGSSHAHGTRDVTLSDRGNNWMLGNNVQLAKDHDARDLKTLLSVSVPAPVIRRQQDESEEERTMTGPDDGKPVEDIGISITEDVHAPNEEDHGGSADEGEMGTQREPHVWIGISLILGFILMYLIDRLPQHAFSSSQPRRFYVSLDRITLRRTPSQTAEEGHDESFEPPDSTYKSRPSSTTVGLVIHAAADGIALGASSASSSSRLSFIIFLALMIHKAPAAFGLTSVLLKQGLSKRSAKTHLIVFSLAAPVGALATWIAANLFGGGSFGGEEGTKFATGVLLLFSGGTFLYVEYPCVIETDY